MKLRQRVLLIFLGLGVFPILAAGWMAHRRTLASIEELVASQAQERADGVAAEIQDRFQPRRSELLYFAENTETLRLLQGWADGPDPRVHLEEAWGSLGSSFAGLELASAEGGIVYSLGRPLETESGSNPGGFSPTGVSVREEILDPTTGLRIGYARAALDPSTAFPPVSEASAFGRHGDLMVADRETGRILAHGSRRAVGQPLITRLPSPQGSPEAFSWPEPRAVQRLSARDSLWVAAVALVPRTPWAVVSLASVDEFSTGIVRTGQRTLGFVVLIAALALVVGMFATTKALGSLEALTVAAGEISGGDFDPELPEPGSDEVGTLSRAFKAMASQIEGMIRRVEENRQLAAVGEFASQIAHEIRNPLTAIRVNLQALQRDVADSPLAEDHGRPLEITIGEVDRLDRVTRGVLTLAQSPMKDPKVLSLHTEIRTAVETLQPELDRMNVTVETSLAAEKDRVYGNGPGLRGAILNLVRNGAEAMSAGGTVRLSTEVGPGGKQGWVRLHVMDEGPGVSESVRPGLFDPFVTTKEEGSGLGLAVALRTAEAHEGTLRLSETQPSTGAHFTMELPLMEGAKQ